MAKGIYIGVSSKARKVNKAYIGVDGKARKVKKGYIGVNGVARLFYSAETLVPFTSNPVPTTWDDTSLKSDTATNDYGTWRITSSSTNNNAVKNAFDNSTSTAWQSTLSETVDYVTLKCPTDITINPTEITIKYNGFDTSSLIQGQQSNDEWVDLATIDRKTSATTTTFSIETDEYYKAIRIVANRISSSHYRYLYDFKINSGTLKIE